MNDKHEGRMGLIDSLEEEFPTIRVDDRDRNGNQYARARWIYPKRLDRRGNVIIELWDKTRTGGADIVISRDLLTPEENKRAPLDGNGRPGNKKRGRLRLHNVSDTELYDFVRDKIIRYCEMM